MKRFLLAASLLAAFALQAQRPLTTAPSGGNKKAKVSESIGIIDVTVRYERPRVKGRVVKDGGNWLQ